MRPACSSSHRRDSNSRSVPYRGTARPLSHGGNSRGGGSRTHDLTVPNRARCLCATPRCGGPGGTRTLTLPVAGRVRFHCATSPLGQSTGLAPVLRGSPPRALLLRYDHHAAESEGVEPSDPLGHPLSRRVPGTDAGRALQSRKGRESNPQGSSLTRFRDGRHHQLACPSSPPGETRTRVSRVSGEGTHRCATGDRVSRMGIEPTSCGVRDRCNASVCYRLVVPPPGVEPGPSAFRADTQTSYARVG